MNMPKIAKKKSDYRFKISTKKRFKKRIFPVTLFKKKMQGNGTVGKFPFKTFNLDIIILFYQIWIPSTFSSMKA